MKKITFIIVLIITLCQWATAQDAVTDIVVEQMEVNGEPTLVVTYTLNKVGSDSYFDVSLKATVDGRPVKVEAVEGEGVGKYIRRGTKKRIEWKITRDVPEIDGRVSIKVLAVPSMKENQTVEQQPARSTPKPSVGPLAGIGSLAATGGGLVILGFTQESQASTDYDDYSNNRDPNSAFYIDNNISRDELYDQANKKHKTAQLMMIGGAVVIVAASGILASRLINNRKMAKNRTSITPHIEIGTNFDYTYTQPSNSYGFKVSHNF